MTSSTTTSGIYFPFGFFRAAFFLSPTLNIHYSCTCDEDDKDETFLNGLSAPTFSRSRFRNRLRRFFCNESCSMMTESRPPGLLGRAIVGLASKDLMRDGTRFACWHDELEDSEILHWVGITTESWFLSHRRISIQELGATVLVPRHSFMLFDSLRTCIAWRMYFIPTSSLLSIYSCRPHLLQPILICSDLTCHPPDHACGFPCPSRHTRLRHFQAK